VSQNHLLRRNAVFYYHRRVPLPLVEELGKKVILFSLGTKDPKEAKRLRAAHDLRWDARFHAVGPGPGKSPQGGAAPPSEPGLLQLVQNYVERADSKARTLALADPPDSMAQKAEIRTDAEIERDILKNIDDPRGAEWVQATGAKILSSSGAALLSSNSDIFAEIVRRGLLELQNRQLARLEDDFSHRFFDQAFNPQRETSKATFGQVADQFIALTDENAKANGTSQKWVEKQRANVAALNEIVGEATAIGDVHYDACIRVRTALAGLPANRNKIYGGLSVEEAIRRAKFDGKPLLSSVTQDQYLATLRAILDLAAKKRLIGVNPAADLKPLKKDTVSAADKRLPFTPLQLTQFFQGPYYRTCAQQASPAFTYDKAGWRFWMPLMYDAPPGPRIMVSASVNAVVAAKCTKRSISIPTL